MTEQRIYTTNDVAEASGITTARVRRIAIDLRKGRKIGRDRFFTEAEYEWFRNRPDRRRKILSSSEQDAI